MSQLWQLSYRGLRGVKLFSFLLDLKIFIKYHMLQRFFPSFDEGRHTATVVVRLSLQVRHLGQLLNLRGFQSDCNSSLTDCATFPLIDCLAFSRFFRSLFPSFFLILCLCQTLPPNVIRHHPPWGTLKYYQLPCRSRHAFVFICTPPPPLPDVAHAEWCF